MTNRKMSRLVATALVLIAVGVACDDDGGEGNAVDEDPAAELTGAPVKLMTIGGFTAAGSDYTQIPEAAQAAADAINADGGIDGSPVEIIVCDHHDANEAAECGRQAVAEDVVATVGTFSSESAQFLPVLQDAGIPQVAVFPVGFEDYTNPMSYPVFGGALSLVAGMGAQLADSGAATINVAYLDIEVGALSAELVATGADPRGASVEESVPVPDGATEYTPQVAEVIANEPDAVAILLTSRDAPTFLRQLKQTDYEGDIATGTSSVTPNQLDELGDITNGLQLPSGFKPSTLTDDPAVAGFNEEMEQYAPEASRDDTAQNAWLGVHLVAQVLEGKPNVSAASLRDALDNAGTIDLGIVAPFSFEQGVEIPAIAPGLELRVFNTKVVYTVVEDGQQVAVDDGQFVDVLES